MRRPPRAALAVSVLLVFSGCLGFGGPPPSDPGAEAIVDATAANADGVETYRFENDIRVVATDGEDSKRVSMTADGVVNRTDRRLRAVTTFEGETRETYVVGDKAYTECPDPWGWGVENTSDDHDGDWTTADPLGRQVALLQASPVYWAGNETVDGVRFHVVEARPSAATLNEYADRRRGSLIGPSIEDATLTAYVDADSHRIRQTVFAFTVTDGGASADARMTTRFEDVGTTVTITVPEEARENPHRLGCPGT